MDDPHLEADRMFGPCLDPTCPGSTGLQTAPPAAPYARPVTLTRRTARFGELAAQVEERLAQLGVVVDPKDIDEDLRTRIRAVAQQLGVSDRTALRYATDTLADEIAKVNVLIARAQVQRHDEVTDPAPRRGHLRLVR